MNFSVPASIAAYLALAFASFFNNSALISSDGQDFLDAVAVQAFVSSVKFAVSSVVLHAANIPSAITPNSNFFISN
jgi:hypothetical protein